MARRSQGGGARYRGCRGTLSRGSARQLRGGSSVSAIETEALGRRYGRRWGLEDCSLTVPRGRVVGLVGPNGAGKTTLLHMAVGLLAPTVGTIRVLDGPPPRERPEQLRRIGFVAQDKPLYRGFKVKDMVRFGAALNADWDQDWDLRPRREVGIPLGP